MVDVRAEGVASRGIGPGTTGLLVGLALALGLGLGLAAKATAAEALEAPADTGTWFDGIAAGACFDDVFTTDGDFDFDVPARIVPCGEPHQNETVAAVHLGAPADAYPGDGLGATLDSACATEYEAFLGRPIESSLVEPFSIIPGADDWDAGVRHGLCTVYTGDSVPGTAASGSLQAPGEVIAAYREVDQVPDIWLIDAGTGEPMGNLTENDVNELVTAPSWSPDGSGVTVSLEAGSEDEESDVYLVAIMDGTAEPILDSPAAEDSVVYSPDGMSIAFIRREGPEEFDIFRRDLDSGETVRLTDHPDRDSSPAWSPDGTRIAFRRRTDDKSDIWVMAADGTGARQLTNNTGQNYDPRWSPDGAYIAFTTKIGADFDIGIMGADGSDQRILTDHPADDEFPSWSSDGQVIAFHSSRHGGVSLWLMRADGSDASELTGLAPLGFAAFSPDPVATRALLEVAELEAGVTPMLASPAAEPEVPEIVIAGPDEPGQPLRITGRVLDEVSGRPIPGADITIYQTDGGGEYEPADRSDQSTARLRGELATDPQGRFAFRTILPGEYPGQPPGNRHIHVHSVSAEGYAPRGFVVLFDDNVREEVRTWAESTGFGRIIETSPEAGVLRGSLDIELEPLAAATSPEP